MLTIDGRADAVGRFADLRAREFSRLDELGLAYLDYTGSALYGASQIRAHHRLLESGVFGNPHSDSTPSRRSTEIVKRAAGNVLRFFGVDAQTHVVCFTRNATAAIKLVAESYPFSQSLGLLLSSDNHNSVNGMREYAQRAGARIRYLPLDRNLRLDDPLPRLADEVSRAGGGLFAFPAQSNFSGLRHPLSLVRQAKDLGLDVLLDAAAFVSTGRLSLENCPADFTVLSFYKLFGYPTGLGALIARRDAMAKLHRPWFSGGTVIYASIQLGIHELKEGSEGFEDGSPDFLGIAALEPGFDLLAEAGMPEIAAHVSSLTARLLNGLRCLTHADGTRLVRLYGPSTMMDRGGTIAFNVIDPTGRVVPFAAVEERARSAGIAIRGGCFCNPGASEAAFGYDVATLGRCLGRGFTIERFADCIGPAYAAGAVRASLGLANTGSDVQRLLDVVDSFRDGTGNVTVRSAAVDPAPSTCCRAPGGTRAGSRGRPG